MYKLIKCFLQMKFEISPLVKSLTGIIPHENEKSVKEEYYHYLTAKYSTKKPHPF